MSALSHKKKTLAHKHRRDNCHTHRERAIYASISTHNFVCAISIRTFLCIKHHTHENENLALKCHVDQNTGTTSYARCCCGVCAHFFSRDEVSREAKIRLKCIRENTMCLIAFVWCYHNTRGIECCIVFVSHRHTYIGRNDF